MSVFNSVVIIFCVIKLSLCLNRVLESVNRNESMCEKMIKKSYFEMELVVGEPWRILYTWNMSMDDKCLDMTFYTATPAILNEVWNDMNEYLEDQPIWPGATLYMTMGPSHYELLMFAQPGSAGGFTAVPNIAKKASLPPQKHTVPLLTFYLALVEKGKFLVMIDCQVGVGSLSARQNIRPTKDEVLLAVKELDLGDGFLTCTGDKKEFLQEHLVK